MKSLFEKYEFSNTEFLVDRGFNTGSDKQLMSSNGNTYIAYRDTTRAGAERRDYIKAMSMGKSGCTEEGLPENEQYFGLFLLETNDFEADAETIFCHYKNRWSIKTYYNYVRNDVDFNALYQQDFFRRR